MRRRERTVPALGAVTAMTIALVLLGVFPTGCGRATSPSPGELKPRRKA